MKRSSEIIFIALFQLFPLLIFAQSAKERILKERIEKEKSEVSYAVKVSQQEQEVFKAMAVNTLLKLKKLDLLSRSSKIMKGNCLFFDKECRKIYNMSLAYLQNEIHLTKKELDDHEILLKESVIRLDDLNEKLALLEKGIEVETESLRIPPAIPELKKGFKCEMEPGWNISRGVFINPSEIKDLPFQVFVKDVVSLKGDGKVVVVEAADILIHFTYVKTPYVKAGDILNMGKKLFSGSSGNPVKPGYVLIFITKNGKFINPGFLCR